MKPEERSAHISENILITRAGRLAQMVERSLSMREVLGSIPRSSRSGRICDGVQAPAARNMLFVDASTINGMHEF